MGRAEQRLYTAGRFWLAEREQSPFYQIRWYDARTKATRGKSTGCRDLDDAIAAILRHAEDDRAKRAETPEAKLMAAVLKTYWEERGQSRINSAATANSIRVFSRFLEQDIGIDATVADMKPDVFQRFREWRLKPHSYERKGGPFASKGVSGETVQRNLDDVRAALNYAADMGRIPYAPKVASVPTDLRSPPREVTLTIDELGAIVGYAAYDIEALRWVLGMIATACRPDAVLKWNVAKQWRGGALDTHPFGAPKTKKRNAVVPVIPEFKPWLEAWAKHPHKAVKSRKTWWRTMRAALGLPANVVPKTIRHTIATELRARGVSLSDIAGLLGHVSESRITQIYAKYDPDRMASAKQQLSAIWQEVCASANEWLTNHIRVTPQRGRDLEVVRKSEKVLEIPSFFVVGADGLEPPTLSV